MPIYLSLSLSLKNLNSSINNLQQVSKGKVGATPSPRAMLHYRSQWHNSCEIYLSYVASTKVLVELPVRMTGASNLPNTNGKAESPLSAVTLTGLRNRGQHQKGSPVLLPGIFRSPFNTPFGEIMGTGLATRKKRPSLWATSQQREFRLFQLCNSEFSDPQVTCISTGGSIVDTDGMMELDLFSVPPPPAVAFRRSEMPSGQILWHLVACPSNRAFRSRKELAVGCGPQRAWGGCTTPSVRFCCIFVCQTESKGFAPYFWDPFTFLDFFSTDLASRRTPGP